MTRSEFISRMAVAEAYLRQCDALGKALKQHLSKDDHAPTITLGSELLGAYLDLLEEAMGDTGRADRSGRLSYSSWVRWYLWESGSHDRVCTVGDRRYLVQDAGMLYDVITEWKKLP